MRGLRGQSRNLLRVYLAGANPRRTQWTRRELNPHPQCARLVASRSHYGPAFNLTARRAYSPVSGLGDERRIPFVTPLTSCTRHSFERTNVVLNRPPWWASVTQVLAKATFWCPVPSLADALTSSHITRFQRHPLVPAALWRGCDIASVTDVMHHRRALSRASQIRVHFTATWRACTASSPLKCQSSSPTSLLASLGTPLRDSNGWLTAGYLYRAVGRYQRDGSLKCFGVVVLSITHSTKPLGIDGPAETEPQPNPYPTILPNEPAHGRIYPHNFG